MGSPLSSLESRRYEVDKRSLFSDIGYSPHAGQWEVHSNRKPRRVLACGVRWGKTKCASMEAVSGALQPSVRGAKEPTVGWVVAPTYDLADRVYREVLVTFGDRVKDRLVSHKYHERKIVIRNLTGGLCEIRAKSADNPVSLLGEGLDWLIMDECARLKPQIWQSYLSQRLIDKDGWALMISTPRGKGWFYQAYLRGKPGSTSCLDDWRSWNSPTWENPHVRSDLIRVERRRLPEAVFDQEYGADFVEGAGTVFRNVEKSAVLEGWTDPIPGQRYSAGLDLAKVEDYTVLTVVDRGGHLVYADRFRRLDWGLQMGRILPALRRYGNPRLLVDSTGLGDPICESLQQHGCNAVGYAFSQASKSRLVNHLALKFEQGALKLPSMDVWPEGIEELQAFQYTISDAGNVRMEAPRGSHDDCVMSLALAVWDAIPTHETFWEEEELLA